MEFMVAAALGAINAARLSLDLRVARVSPGTDVEGPSRDTPEVRPCGWCAHSPVRTRSREGPSTSMPGETFGVGGKLPTQLRGTQGGQKCLQWFCNRRMVAAAPKLRQQQPSFGGLQTVSQSSADS